MILVTMRVRSTLKVTNPPRDAAVNRMNPLDESDLSSARDEAKGLETFIWKL